MSDTDKPIMPSPNQIHASHNALARYRMVFTTLHVFRLAENGRRLEINDDGRIIVFDLSAGQAEALAGLLCGVNNAAGGDLEIAPASPTSEFERALMAQILSVRDRTKAEIEGACREIEAISRACRARTSSKARPRKAGGHR
jgi:hypothetical protein